MQHASVKTQFLVTIALALAFCLVLSLLAYREFHKLLTDKDTGYATNEGVAYAYGMFDLLERLENLSGLLQQESALQTLLQSPLNSQTSELTRRLSTLFYSFLATNLDMADISIASPDVNWSAYYRTETLDAFRETLGDTRRVFCLGLRQDQLVDISPKPALLVFGYNIYASPGRKKLGALIFSMDLSKSTISGASPSASRSSPAYHFLGNPAEGLTALHAAAPHGEEVTQDLLSHMDQLPRHTQEPVQLETALFRYVMWYAPDNNFYATSAIDRSVLARDMDMTRFYVIGVGAMFTLLLLAMFSLLKRNVADPLHTLHGHMRSIREGNRRDMRRPIALTGCRELRELSDEFNGMLREIVTLEEQLFDTVKSLYELDIERQQAEIAYLRSQINPHFLYNTLETIKGIALTHHVPAIGDIASAMGRIYRYSIKGSSTVTLGQEMEITDAYIQIQQARFQHRFDCIRNIPEQLKGVQVLKMLLQPLVENAIVHGLEERSAGGTLYISARAVQGVLTLSVMDDGAGMPPERLQAIQAALDSGEKDGPGVGLSNIHHRIRLCYGKPYGLTLESAPNGGTRATITLPMASRKEEDHVQRHAGG